LHSLIFKFLTLLMVAKFITCRWTWPFSIKGINLCLPIANNIVSILHIKMSQHNFNRCISLGFWGWHYWWKYYIPNIKAIYLVNDDDDHYQQRHHLFNLDLDHHCIMLKYSIKLSSIHENMEKCQYKYDKKASILILTLSMALKLFTNFWMMIIPK